jgi:hypothetical protein
MVLKIARLNGAEPMHETDSRSNCRVAVITRLLAASLLQSMMKRQVALLGITYCQNIGHVPSDVYSICQKLPRCSSEAASSPHRSVKTPIRIQYKVR